MPGYYPAFIDLRGRHCLVVGGGQVAERKAAALLESGGRVTVVSPRLLTERLRAWAAAGTITHLARDYQAGDTAGAFLVISATDVAAVNREIARECTNRGVLLNVVDAPQLCNFIVPSTVRAGDLTLAISTAGKSPRLAKKIRQELQERYGEEYAVLLNLLGELREELQVTVPDGKKRREIWEAMPLDEMLELIRHQKISRAKERAQQCISSWLV